MKSVEDTQNGQQFNQSQATRSRKKGFIALAAVLLVAGSSCAGYTYFIGSRYVTTDNAYTAAEIAEVTPAVGGIVSAVNVVDTQHIEKGDILITLDDTDERLALAQAKASYGQAQRRVRGYLANAEAMNAMVKAREADEKRAQAQLAAAKADFERAQIDFHRRQELVRSGSVSGEELTNAKTAFAQAEANLHVAEAAGNQAEANRLSTIGDRKANNALIENSTIETNPEVLLAKARHDQAQIDLERTVIRAPISGIVAKRQVQVGRRVQVGATLLTIVPVDNIHVDANFKEGKLRKVKVGQHAEITADIYGDEVVYHGVITGLSGGTGSAFSLIPAQNATGNWIKVVQRLPVRIEISREDLCNHALQVGLSMDVTIDTNSMVDAATLARYQAAPLQEQQTDVVGALASANQAKDAGGTL